MFRRLTPHAFMTERLRLFKNEAVSRACMSEDVVDITVPIVHPSCYFSYTHI